LAGFVAPFFFAAFATGFAAGLALPLADVRATGAALLDFLPPAARALATGDTCLVLAEGLALLAVRFAAGM
jgi:hypothetical protein